MKFSFTIDKTNVKSSAAQFFAFFAKTKDGRAKDFSRKMTCEKFAKNDAKQPQNLPSKVGEFYT